MSREETLINSWKRQALEGMSGIFSGKAEAKAAEKDGEIEKLHVPLPGSTCLHVREGRSASWWWNAIF